MNQVQILDILKYKTEIMQPKLLNLAGHISQQIYLIIISKHPLPSYR